jgi:hypothetical protein
LASGRTWLEPENPDWPGNYPVQYWRPERQALLFGSPNAYLDRALDAGFDGVYLDRVDKFERWKRRRPSAARHGGLSRRAIASETSGFRGHPAKRRRTAERRGVPADDRRLRTSTASGIRIAHSIADSVFVVEYGSL